MAAKLEDFDIDTMAMHQGTQWTMYTMFSFSILPFWLFEISSDNIFGQEPQFQSWVVYAMEILSGIPHVQKCYQKGSNLILILTHSLSKMNSHTVSEVIWLCNGTWQKKSLQVMTWVINPEHILSS